MERRLWDYFEFLISKWKPRKKFSRSYLQGRNLDKWSQKEFLMTTWEYLNCKKTSQQLPSCVIVTRESLFCKIFSPLFLFKQVKTLKNLLQKPYTSDGDNKQTKKEAETRNSVWPKLAEILEQSSGTIQVCVSVFLLLWSLYKTNRFHVAVDLWSNRLRKTSKVGKNISNTFACGSCATSLPFCHILMSSVIYNWTDARQHGIYLLNMLQFNEIIEKHQLNTYKITCSNG